MAPDTVDSVVAGHQRQGIGLLYADFKAPEVDFPQGPHGKPGIVVGPVGLLVVAGKMLGAGAAALYGLNAPDHSRRHFAG